MQYAKPMSKYFLLIVAAFFLFTPLSEVFAQNPVDTTGLKITISQNSETISRETLESWKNHNSSFLLSPDQKREIENTSYCPVNKIFCFLTLTQSQKNHFALKLDTTINTEKIKAYVEDLARKTNRDPEDAKFKVEDGIVKTFSEASEGITLDQEKSIEILKQATENNSFEVSLPFESKKPTTNYAEINNLGISSIIGQGTSNFKGSPTNRVHNIRVAAQRFNGLLIKPGEEFSFVKNLGEVDGDHGYLPELVIKKNVTEKEFGGGICQVSSTAFRAAIYSGLKITARRNHAYPVSYYNPQGMDSTVYVPNPDLKFINNTPNYILIQTSIVGTQLNFDFYGTSDGRKVTVDGPYLTDKQPDGAMKAHFTQHVFDKNGNEFINDVFNSSYSSPYKFPHLGGPVLTAKPANWSNDEWKNYKQTLKDLAKASQ